MADSRGARAAGAAAPRAGTEEAEEAVAAAPDGSPEPDEPQLEPILAGAHGVGARFAGRIGRHAGFYGAASVSGMLAGLVSVAVFTRFLGQAEFGRMAVFSTIATIITTVATLAIMQGTMRRIYGTTGDDEAAELDAGGRTSEDARTTLSTGLVLSFLFGAILFLAAVALQSTVSDLLGGPRNATLMVLAAAAGVAGGVMRFARNILRLQLRPAAYLAVTLVYAFGSIPVAIPLLAGGLGVEAVLIGFLVANALAAALCMGLLVSDLRLGASPREAWEIVRAGSSFAPIMVAFHAVQLGDTLLVAGMGSFSETGLYRVAQRISMPVSYGTSVFQQSWGPLKRDMTNLAVERVDETRAYTAHLFTYYAVFVVGVILPIAVLAEQLVRVASGQFGAAATLVPLTALSVAGHGWFVFAYRNARLPGQILWMIGLALFAAVAFIGLSVLLIPAMGAVGAPLAAIASWTIATLVMLVANQLLGEPIPFEYRNLLLLLVLAVSVWLLSSLVLPDTTAGTGARLALLFGWAVALLLTGVVPRRDVTALARLIRDATGIDSSRTLRGRLAALEGADALLVDGVVRRRLPAHEVAARASVSEEEALARTIHVLRGVAGGTAGPKETDAELGSLLLRPRPSAERDLGVKQLVDDGLDPIDVDLIKRALAAAGSRRSRRS